MAIIKMLFFNELINTNTFKINNRTQKSTLQFKKLVTPLQFFESPEQL